MQSVLKRPLPIRHRLILTVTTMVFVIAFIGGFLFNEASYLTEDSILDARLKMEMDALAATWHETGLLEPAASRLMQSSLNGADLPAAVTAVVADLPAGIHEPDTIDLGDGPLDMKLGIVPLSDNQRLVVWYKTWVLEEKEDAQFWRFMLAILIPCFLGTLAWLSINAFSNLIFRPLERLARLVSQRDDGEALLQPLQGQFSRDEIGEIAAVIDKHLVRIRAFTERERYFTRDASHELRTPVAVIGAALDCLNEADLSPKDNRSIQRIRRACSRMQRHIDAFLLLARDGALGDASLTPAAVLEQIDLPESNEVVIAEACVTTTYPAGELLIIIFDNLVRNAVRHGDGSLAINWKKDEIRVSNPLLPDNPPPVNPLEPYVRSDHSDGFGLGLDIVVRLVKRMGWQLDVEQTSTTFAILLRPNVEIVRT